MELEDRDFLNTPPTKTVRFGGNVVNTLAKFERGDTSDYELLKHQLTDPDIKDGQVINWLQEFRKCVTLLTKDHEQLVYAVLRLPWLGRSAAVVEEYLAFLSNLVSAQTVYLRHCLKMVVSNFTPGKVVIREGDVDISDSDDEDENLPRNFDLCHHALQLIARYVPFTSRFLMPILNENFPFVQKSSRTQECYVHNLLRVTVHFPALRRDVLELVIGRMLKLDASAPRGDIEEAEESSAHQPNGGGVQDECVFDMDEDDGPETKVAVGTAGAMAMAHPVAERLDSLMAVVLAYVKDTCYLDGCLELDRTKDLYRDLVSLPPGPGRGVSRAPVEGGAEPRPAPVLRQAAATYIGSFLARAKFLPVATVKACLDLLVPWLQRYIDGQDSGGRAFCDVSLHGPFYSACQTVFYTLVFRHRAIVEGNMRQGLAYLQSLNLERIVMSQLNPLKVCLPAITSMFAAITRKYQLVFCYTIIERNHRLMLPTVRSSHGGDATPANTNPLDSFFPFDPYLLKRSGKFIEPLYQVWEEPGGSEVDAPRKPVRQPVRQGSEEDDDFLRGETPQTDGAVAMTPGSYSPATRPRPPSPSCSAPSSPAPSPPPRTARWPPPRTRNRDDRSAPLSGFEEEEEEGVYSGSSHTTNPPLFR
ncbi:hypothetical protein AAFF_G00212600 [Aldrovandia affinis]|uniref:RNA polymerase I-specific transcription initiation factor RRN3 n=1 Tax=Aldrovandia affinis TaxID=143900 RepID=A0AAD7RGU6_9TELE|nr:hypothetical protein AAFF_G00212600 [Aldrovandia affinis]